TVRRVDAVLVEIEPALPGDQVAHLDKAQRVVGIGKAHSCDRRDIGDEQQQRNQHEGEPRALKEKGIDARPAIIAEHGYAACSGRNTIRLRRSQVSVKLATIAAPLAIRGSRPARSPSPTITVVSARPSSAETTN